MEEELNIPYERLPDENQVAGVEVLLANVRRFSFRRNYHVQQLKNFLLANLTVVFNSEVLAVIDEYFKPADIVEILKQRRAPNSPYFMAELRQHPHIDLIHYPAIQKAIKRIDSSTLIKCSIWDRIIEDVALTGMNVNARDSLGNTLLHHLASWNFNRERLDEVLSGGAAPHFLNHAGQTPGDVWQAHDPRVAEELNGKISAVNILINNIRKAKGSNLHAAKKALDSFLNNGPQIADSDVKGVLHALNKYFTVSEIKTIFLPSQVFTQEINFAKYSRVMSARYDLLEKKLHDCSLEEINLAITVSATAIARNRRANPIVRFFRNLRHERMRKSIMNYIRGLLHDEDVSQYVDALDLLRNFSVDEIVAFFGADARNNSEWYRRIKNTVQINSELFPNILSAIRVIRPEEILPNTFAKVAKFLNEEYVPPQAPPEYQKPYIPPRLTMESWCVHKGTADLFQEKWLVGVGADSARVEPCIDYLLSLDGGWKILFSAALNTALTLEPMERKYYFKKAVAFGGRSELSFDSSELREFAEMIRSLSDDMLKQIVSEVFDEVASTRLMTKLLDFMNFYGSSYARDGAPAVFRMQ